jgi:uncharacterized protein (DUF2147 family)
MRTKPALAVAALLALGCGIHGARADMTPVGLWQSVDPKTRQPTGWFLISEHGGVYDGTLVKMFLQPGQDPNVVCDRCRGDRHDRPWLGLQIIRGMKPNGHDKDKYDGGTILDPRDGSVYDAMMTLTPDGQTLVVRGYLGISFLGRNEYWTRLPDSDYSMLDPSIKNMLNSPSTPAPAAPPANR